MGAWIETAVKNGKKKHLIVAPRMGAWIETDELPKYRLYLLSRPAWARGLKHKMEEYGTILLSRAPHGRVD